MTTDALITRLEKCRIVSSEPYRVDDALKRELIETLEKLVTQVFVLRMERDRMHPHFYYSGVPLARCWAEQCAWPECSCADYGVGPQVALAGTI